MKKTILLTLIVISLTLASIIPVMALNITLYYNETTEQYDSSGYYISSADNYGGSPAYACELEWEEDTPFGTDIVMQLRSGDSDPPTGDFLGPDGTSSTIYQTSPSVANTTHNPDSYIQWKALLSTTDTSVTPILYNVTFSCYSSCTTNNDCVSGYFCVDNECIPNSAPEMTGITDSPDPIKGGTTITIAANSVIDLQDDTLYLYCGTTTTPNSTNTICTGGTTSDTGTPYDLDCTFDVVTDDTSHTVYCRLYDGEFYSDVNSTSYTTDSTPPVAVTVQNVEGDTLSPYWDTSNNTQTTIQTNRPEAGMYCRWSTSDVAYSGINSANECTVGADSVSCNLGSLSQSSSYTYYISCKDEVSNEQSSAQNTDIVFGVDWSEPTTYVSGYGSYYIPGHNVTLHEEDNIGTPATILTWHCTSDSGCTPATAIDNLDEVSFTARGTNYIRWFSRDAAANDQPTQTISVEINSLPVVNITLMQYGVGSGDYTGRHGKRVYFYCDGYDANSAIDGNLGYSANIWLKSSGAGTWNRIDSAAMTWSAIDNRFFYDYLLDDPEDIYGTSFDMVCEITDDLNESSNNTKNSIFSVLNTAPFVDDIFVSNMSAKKFDTVRWYCSGQDADAPTHQESNLVSRFWLKIQGTGTWNIIENESMSWDGTDHYIDYFITDDGDTHYDAQCQLSDGVDESTLYYELQTEYNVSDDWDNDGISDATDTLEGTGSSLDTGLTNVTIKVDGVINNSPSGSRTVTFEDSGTEFVRFINDFDTNELLTPLITVDRISSGERGSVLISGLEGIIKTLRVPKLLGAGLVCVKNSSVTIISEITAGCSAADEILFDKCNTGQTISGITCTDNITYYEVNGVTHSAAVEFGTARLEIWSEGTYWQLDTINFFANYTNSSSGTAITGADCNIWFDDTGWDDMIFDGTLHNYNLTFSSAGYRDYNISCTHATYTNLTVQDSFTISQSAIPEFSILTLGLGLAAVLLGLFLIRRR